MPAFLFRWLFRAQSLKSLERSMHGLCGIGPNRKTLLGMVEGIDVANGDKWLARPAELGRAGR